MPTLRIFKAQIWANRSELMESVSVKQEARRLVDALAEDATWDDLMDKIYVRQAIEVGLKDSEAERTLDVAEVRAKFGLQP